MSTTDNGARFPGRLRTRIVISFLLFGILLSLLFAVTTIGMRQYLSNQLIDATLSTDLRQHLDDLLSGSAVPGDPFSTRYTAWIGAPENFREERLQDPELRRFARDLAARPSGSHRLRVGDQRYRVAIDKRDAVWGLVLYNETRDPREKWILPGAVLTTFALLSLLALGLAIWSSKRVMAPVIDLARRISGMGQTHPQALAPNYADDEVGRLAEALDGYAERLTALVERDKEFNADVSHELRTPLAVIRSSVELMLGQPDLPDKTRGRLERIDRAARQSIELTEALLHLVRAEKMDHATGEFYRIERIVDQVVDFKRPTLANKPVQVNVHLNESFLVCAPAAVIAVTVGNLIGNAFKYTPKGAVDITVQDNQVVVEDTGPGLDQDELQRVFTRHYRGSSATGKGSGLGLAIVQRICDLYDWRISIRQRTGGGLRASLDFGTSAAAIPP